MGKKKNKKNNQAETSKATQDTNFLTQEGKVIYKETITAPVTGAAHYEPLRHCAETHLLLSPQPRGTGFICEDKSSPKVFDRKWSKVALNYLADEKHPGVLMGAELTDVKATIITGLGHHQYTRSSDFRETTTRAVRQGLMKAKRDGNIILLEPWYQFKYILPEENVGKCLGDIMKMGGDFSQPQQSAEDGGLREIEGRIPVSEVLQYEEEYKAYTHGRGVAEYQFSGYDACHDAQRVIKEAAYDPDRDLENPSWSWFCPEFVDTHVKWDEVDVGWFYLKTNYKIEDYL